MLGENIKKYRDNMGKTQEDIAKFLGVAPQTIYKYEKNINEPDTTTLSKLADYFEITVDELLGRKGEIMDISLSPDNEKFIQKQIADGIYASIKEAINAAINLAITNTTAAKQIEAFNNEIEIGWNAMEKNDVLNGKAVMEELKNKYDL